MMRWLFVMLVVTIWRPTNTGRTPKITELQYQTNSELPEELFSGFYDIGWMDQQQDGKQQLGNGFKLEVKFQNCIGSDSEWDGKLCPTRTTTAEEQGKLFNAIIHQMVTLIPIKWSLFGKAEFASVKEKLLQMQVPKDLVELSSVTFCKCRF